MKKILIPLMIVGGVVADQLVKLETVKNIPLGESKSVIKGVFSLTHLQNTGAAWSLMEGKQWFFTLITILALTVGSYFLLKNINKRNGISYTVALILTGALGNFIDRIRLGYVVDMFQVDFINFPIFNLADIFLCIGVVLLYIAIYYDDKKKESQKN
ncbi:signal peptidase II [Streptococcaceae bacterium ESL0729]|nr:signal peptidase II [Streptococcaceae bacterium ESL0729]